MPAFFSGAFTPSKASQTSAIVPLAGSAASHASYPLSLPRMSVGASTLPSGWTTVVAMPKGWNVRSPTPKATTTSPERVGAAVVSNW